MNQAQEPTYAEVTLGVHRWTFPRCTLEESAAIAGALGFQFLDLGNSFDHDPAAVTADVPKAVARSLRIRDITGVRSRDAFLHFPLRFSTNHPEDRVRAANLEIAHAYFIFAQQAGLTGVTFSPGAIWSGEPANEALERAAAALRELVALGSEAGLKVRVEPHVGSVTETVPATLELLDAVPGLTLTLDYSHYVYNGVPGTELQLLHGAASHWHVRQAAPGRLQTSGQAGTINVPDLVDSWRTEGYKGGVCLEYVNSPWMQQNGIDCLSETVELRDLILERMTNW